MASAERTHRTGLALLVALGCLLRALYWYSTGSTLEDALITFRYAENLASGMGFVYNAGEHVLGTSAPLWTLLLAAVRSIGIPDVAACAKILALVLDAFSMIAVFTLLRPSGLFPAYLGTALFCTSPAIVPISVSGMESPLVVAGMSLALLGFQRRSVLFAMGCAITLLARIDGAIFFLTMMSVALACDRPWALKQAAIALAVCLPWFLFSFFYFGTLLPESLLAKRAAYHGSVASSLEPFLMQYTPYLEKRAVYFIAKSALFILLLAGLVRTVSRERRLLWSSLFFLAYVAILGTSGALVFSWYFVPASFASIILIALGADWFLQGAGNRPKLRVAALWAISFGLCAVHLATLSARAEHSRQLQSLEEHLRKEAGVYLNMTAPAGSQVFLEPLGYVGYYAGPALVVHDEIGLVTPSVVRYRMRGDGWYVGALRELRPDYVLQYAYALEQNVTEGSGVKLFRDEGEQAWFRGHYREIKQFDASTIAPLVASKEKRYILFLRMPVE